MMNNHRLINKQNACPATCIVNTSTVQMGILRGYILTEELNYSGLMSHWGHIHSSAMHTPWKTHIILNTVLQHDTPFRQTDLPHKCYLLSPWGSEAARSTVLFSVYSTTISFEFPMISSNHSWLDIAEYAAPLSSLLQALPSITLFLSDHRKHSPSKRTEHISPHYTKVQSENCFGTPGLACVCVCDKCRVRGERP